MPRQANGQYLPPANTAAVTATTISSTAYNTLETDIGTEITNSLDRLGRSAMQANLPMGGNKITGAADPTVSTDLATKNYIDTLVAAFFSTGDGKITLKNVADTGWVLCDDGTIGSASSGSSTRANIDTQPLFTLLFNNVGDTAAPIFTSGGGATTRAAQTSASAAWAANCRMSLTKVLGRAIAIAGAGAGLTSRALGQTLGTETQNLTMSNLPPITPAGSVSISDPGHSHTYSTGGGPTTAGPGGVGQLLQVPTLFNTSTSGTGITAGFTGIPTGGNSAAFSLIDPVGYWNVMVKL